jgi:phosphoglycerate dehydrogenase-like enzyme
VTETDAPDVAVLWKKIHGMNPERYAEAIRERLPDREVALARTPEARRDLVSRARVVTGHSVDVDAAVDGPMELFACVFAGTDHLPLDALAEGGVAVTNAAGVHGPNVAEHAVGAVLAFTHGFPTAWRANERREWFSYRAGELKGSTVTVVGMGAIGTAVLERLDPFGVDTVGVRNTPAKGGPADEVVGYDEAAVHDAFARSDYVVLACPLTDRTRHLVDEAALATLPPEAVLVNVARGGVVDTDALVSAIRWNEIGGAALDVTDPEPLPPDHPLWGFDDVLVTPHSAGHTPAYFDRLADILADNVARLDAGEELENRVV